MTLTTRGWAACVLAALVIVLAIFAAVTIPWHRPPAPRADQLAALRELPAEQVARARAFHSALRPGSYGSLVIGLIGALLLGLTPLGARLVALVGRPFGGNWVAQAVLGGLAVVLVVEIVTLPFAAWRHIVVVRYGISTQSWGAWALDLVKSTAIGAVLTGGAGGAVVALTRRYPRGWWLPLAGSSIAFGSVFSPWLPARRSSAAIIDCLPARCAPPASARNSRQRENHMTISEARKPSAICSTMTMPK